MRNIVYIAILVFCTQSLLAQNKLLNAIHKLKKGELESARELVDAASEDSLFSERASTWYYKGYIYKDLFKRDEADNKNSLLREKAIAFYKIGYEMDPKGDYANNIANGLRYLSTTYFNHSVTSFSPSTHEEAIKNYENHKATLRIVEPNTDFTEKDINFNLAMASTYGRAAMQDSANANDYLAKAKELYEKILILDSNNRSANYNIGIIYYNEGVEIVNNMNYDLDLFELEMLQDQIVQLFRKSLPYMKKAYDLNPRRKETIEGLQGIYFSLNDIPKSEAYKKQLDLLNGDEVETQPEEPQDN